MWSPGFSRSSTPELVSAMADPRLRDEAEEPAFAGVAGDHTHHPRIAVSVTSG